MKYKKVFWDVDLRMGLDGLGDYAKRRGYSVRALEPGEALLFVNAKLSAFKLLTGIAETDTKGLLSNYHSPHGRIALGAISKIPQSFDPSTGAVNFGKALEAHLEEHLVNKRKPKE